jgi:PTH1 family peptidyl-tRNA hydrolase
MKIVLGIGNPGSEYRGTRHNVGYMVTDILAQRRGVSEGKSRFQSVVAEIRVGNEKVLLVKPVTYVNRSGFAAAAALSYYDLDLKDFIVVCDDMNLPTGKIRIRREGSSGGHNGLKSIVEAVHGEDFARVRIGIGEPEGRRTGVDHVLGRFQTGEETVIRETLERAADSVETWLCEGIEAAMNEFNAPDSATDEA